MCDVRFAKTANRSVVGSMNEFTYSAEFYRDELSMDGLLQMSLRLSDTPCSPLYKSGVTPGRELKRVVFTHQLPA